MSKQNERPRVVLRDCVSWGSGLDGLRIEDPHGQFDVEVTGFRSINSGRHGTSIAPSEEAGAEQSASLPADAAARSIQLLQSLSPDIGAKLSQLNSVDRRKVEALISDLSKERKGSRGFAKAYTGLMALLADHAQVASVIPLLRQWLSSL
jgi:hypothetical protein